MIPPVPPEAVILLAEDLPNDVFLIRRAVANAGIDNPFFVVTNGEECIAYLHGKGQYANRDEFPLPDLLLLDLKMPKMDGFEVLRAIRSERRFASVRIIVLTSSQDIFDVNKAYDLGANSFLVKPHDFENFTTMMRTLAAFWLQQSTRASVTRSRDKGQDPGETAGT